MGITYLSEKYLKTEIENLRSRLLLYRQAYEGNDIKSLLLKRLIMTKEEELRLLESMCDEFAQ